MWGDVERWGEMGRDGERAYHDPDQPARSPSPVPCHDESTRLIN